MSLPKSFEYLVNNLTILPGVGEKTGVKLLNEYNDYKAVGLNWRFFVNGGVKFDGINFSLLKLLTI